MCVLVVESAEVLFAASQCCSVEVVQRWWCCCGAVVLWRCGQSVSKACIPLLYLLPHALPTVPQSHSQSLILTYVGQLVRCCVVVRQRVSE